MHNITGGSIREELDFFMRTAKTAKLTEKFVKGDDPSVVVGGFLEAASQVLSSMRDMYNKHANDRENVASPAIGMMDKIANLAADAKAELQAHLSNGEPEDDNRNIDKS